MIKEYQGFLRRYPYFQKRQEALGTRLVMLVSCSESKQRFTIRLKFFIREFIKLYPIALSIL